MKALTQVLMAINRLSKASLYSWNGLSLAWRSEQAFRLELYVLIIAIPAAFYLGDSAVKRILMINSVLLLPIMELINSAIETTINRIGLEYNPLSGAAKDLASAAIFVAVINVFVTWGIILFELLS